MAKLGLTEKFKKNDGFKVWLRLTMALPLLPTEHIVPAWNDLKAQPLPGLLSSQPFRKLKRYIQSYWIDQKLNVLSVFGSPHRTNNSAESSNSKWNVFVGIKHPNMWFLLDKMYKEFEDVEKEMKSLEIGVKIRRPKKTKNVLNARRLRIAEQKLIAGRNGYDAMAFLREASHSFRESNAEYFSNLLENLDDDPLLGGEVPEDDQSDQDENEGQVETQQVEQNHNPSEQGNPVDDGNLCIICLIKAKDSVFVSCGHNKTCYECGQQWIHQTRANEGGPTCPYCRDKVKDCIRIFS